MCSAQNWAISCASPCGEAASQTCCLVDSLAQALGGQLRLGAIVDRFCSRRPAEVGQMWPTAYIGQTQPVFVRFNRPACNSCSQSSSIPSPQPPRLFLGKHAEAFSPACIAPGFFVEPGGFVPRRTGGPAPLGGPTDGVDRERRHVRKAATNAKTRHASGLGHAEYQIPEAHRAQSCSSVQTRSDPRGTCEIHSCPKLVQHLL